MAKLPNRIVIEMTDIDEVNELGDPVIDFESKNYAECIIEELEKLRDDVVIKLCLGKECDRCLFEGAYGICGVKNFIAERISELKGESK